MIQPPNRVASPAQADPSHEQVSVREEAGATLAALMPWGVSLAIHAALVTLALLVIWAVIDDQETDAGMDVAVMSNPAPASALHSMIQTRDLHDDVPTARPDTAPNPTPAPDTIGTASRDAAVAEVFNTGDLGMPDLGDYTPRAKQGEIFDPRPPKKGIDRPLRVVYVIDASGSLIDTFPFVLRELKRSIAAMPSDHQYTVIFFQDGNVIEPKPLGLKEASPYTRLAMMRWLDEVRPGGRTSPVPALERALSYRPDQVFLLSDNITGGGTGATQMELEQQRLVNVVKQTNRDTRIHTIQYLYPDPLSRAQGMKGTLELISEMTGGDYRYVSEEQMMGHGGGADAHPGAGKVRIDL